MIVTIHQPEHFPYMGFFQKVEAADLFIILDSVKFRKNYFQNRNKILNSSGEEEWITVPVEKKASSKLIKDVYVSRESRWRKKLVKQIKQQYKVDFTNLYSYDKLVDINISSIQWAMKKMNISTEMVLASSLPATGSKSKLLSDLCKNVGATKYLSGPMGRKYLEMSYFDNVEVVFFEPSVKNYYSCLYNLL